MSETKRIAELTARIAELGEELARVKAESLRVVPVGEQCQRRRCTTTYYVVDGGIYCSDWPLPNGIDWDHVVQPVRLERWEGEV
jgi:hypothetical protein